MQRKSHNSLTVVLGENEFGGLWCDQWLLPYLYPRCQQEEEGFVLEAKLQDLREAEGNLKGSRELHPSRAFLMSINFSKYLTVGLLASTFCHLLLLIPLKLCLQLWCPPNFS